VKNLGVILSRLGVTDVLVEGVECLDTSSRRDGLNLYIEITVLCNTP